MKTVLSEDICRSYIPIIASCGYDLQRMDPFRIGQCVRTTGFSYDDVESVVRMCHSSVLLRELYNTFRNDSPVIRN